MKTYAIIVAAGVGHRMGGPVAKQFLPLDGQPVLYHTLCAFEQSEADECIIVTGSGDVPYVRENFAQSGEFTKISAVIPGGRERFDSVAAGVEYVLRNCGAQDEDRVLIHDGVRALVTPEVINRVINALSQYKACCPGVAVKDTVRTVDSDGCGSRTLARRDLRIIQTPQGFRLGTIAAAHERFAGERILKPGCEAEITDDVMLVEKYLDIKAYIVDGSYENIKLTTPEDLLFAEAILKKRKGKTE